MGLRFKMTEIYLIRHGETELNASNTVRGRLEIPLSEHGLKQADLLGAYLKNKKFDAIYSSPLKRAVQTAEAIARYQGLAVQPIEGFNDLDFGKWEGLPFAEVKARYPGDYKLWREQPHLLQIPDGERLDSVRHRAMAALDSIFKTSPKTIAIVTHRVLTKVMVCSMLGLDDSHFWNVEHDTCGVTVFIYGKSGFILLKHNDTCFLT